MRHCYGCAARHDGCPESERGATGFGITPVRCIQLAPLSSRGGPRVRRLPAGGKWIRTSGSGEGEDRVSSLGLLLAKDRGVGATIAKVGVFTRPTPITPL